MKCPECCLDWSCKRRDCVDPKICPELSNLVKNPLNDGNSLFNHHYILLLLEMLTMFCVQFYTFSYFLKQTASMPKCPPCCPICHHFVLDGFCADPKICPEQSAELVKSKEVSGKAKKILST